MGLRVEDIHDPSVARTSSHNSTKDVRIMIERRDQMERELDALADVLKSHGADMDTPLVTRDGFPRDDIDVTTIRATRTRIVRLRNDYINLMSEIENGLREYFSSHNSGSNNTQEGTNLIPRQAFNGSSSITSRRETHVVTPTVPFCYVNSVAPSSPALRAGLVQGDQIISFGWVNASNHQNLSRLAAVATSSLEVCTGLYLLYRYLS